LHAHGKKHCKQVVLKNALLKNRRILKKFLEKKVPVEKNWKKTTISSQLYINGFFVFFLYAFLNLFRLFFPKKRFKFSLVGIIVLIISVFNQKK